MQIQEPLGYFSSKLTEHYAVINRDTRIVTDCIGPLGDVSDVVNHMIEKYRIKDPIIRNWNEYFANLVRFRGLRVSDLGRYFSKMPELNFDHITVGELCDSADLGEWPIEIQAKLLGIK